MNKLKMHSPNLTQENIARIREMFPGCVTEAQGEGGRLKLAVDFDLLRQELSESIVEGPQERYHLNWPGKREALLTANAPIASTLRPRREESVDFDTTKNLFIEGDNLEALKLLQETYLGKVKMIYIDPPYNTGNDFIYEDDFAENAEAFLKRSYQKDEEGNRLIANTEANGRFHSDWLSMMYPRLKLARNLLLDDGIVFVSIDENEITNIQKVCVEIFGADNYMGTIVSRRRQVADNRNQNRMSNDHEYVIVYGKSTATLKGIAKDLNKYTNPDNDHRGPWMSDNLTGLASKEQRPNLHYDIVNPVTGISYPPHTGRGWAYERKRMDQLIAEHRILWPINSDGRPRLKRFVNELSDLFTGFSSWQELGFTTEGTREIREIMNFKAFDFPKPVRLGRILIDQATNPNTNDIILDFFAGSSTSAHAVMQLNAEDGGNRKFIMVQLPEPCDEQSEAFKAGYKTIAEISKERIRRAGQKILEGECHEGWNKDIGFRVLKIDSSNMADVYYTPDAIEQGQLKIFTDNIKSDRKSEDLLFQVLLDWGVDLSLPIRKETIQGKAVFFVNEPPYDLVACFDTGVNEDLVKELAQFEPLRVVFRDTGLVSDAVKINVEQIFKQMSPGTEVKSI